MFSFSCKTQDHLNYSSQKVPNNNFNDNEVFPKLDYTNDKNWAFRYDLHDEKKILPRNYKSKNEKKFDISVFYIHPTTLFSSIKWNADTNHFKNNEIIDLCVENQASLFAGITDLYVPHYREMHIYSYTDTVNGIKAFNIAYNDILNSFKCFLEMIKTEKFIIASHSQGTNHAKKLINEYIINNKDLSDKLILSYLIGMDIHKDEMLIEICKDPIQLNCFLNWRTFNMSYYPYNSKWKYGENYRCVNPISFSTDLQWTDRSQHMGILFPNKKILFKRTLSAKNEKGILWINFKKNIILNRYKRDTYHNADFNLFWLNIRKNLIKRLEYNFI
tara:strand:- start:785 stop:1777 length:993 start_codon:yes stop_codon:yes gene_type:complete